MVGIRHAGITAVPQIAGGGLAVGNGQDGEGHHIVGQRTAESAGGHILGKPGGPLVGLVLKGHAVLRRDGVVVNRHLLPRLKILVEPKAAVFGNLSVQERRSHRVIPVADEKARGGQEKIGALEILRFRHAERSLKKHRMRVGRPGSGEGEFILRTRKEMQIRLQPVFRRRLWIIIAEIGKQGGLPDRPGERLKSRARHLEGIELPDGAGVGTLRHREEAGHGDDHHRQDRKGGQNFDQGKSARRSEGHSHGRNNSGPRTDSSHYRWLKME
jgi:hypothetical protein